MAIQYKTINQIQSTFAAMFPDSNIAKMMTLNRTKSINAINHNLAPIFKSALLSDLQKPDIHIYSFDIILNKVTLTAKWICICASTLVQTNVNKKTEIEIIQSQTKNKTSLPYYVHVMRDKIQKRKA